MLRIIKASDPIVVEQIVLTIYSPPGVGKTSLGFSADAPLLLDTDDGAWRSAFRKDCVRATSWEDIAGITKEDVAPYKTLVLDTSGRALDLLAIHIIATNPKMGRGGALTLQGYGELKSKFVGYLNTIKSFGLDVVLIAHSDEKQQGDETIERIDMQGASKQEVYKLAGAMARLGFIDGKRVLNFSPTETRFGKDPANLGAVLVPDLNVEPQFLGTLIQRIKDAVNKENAAQLAAKAEAEAWGVSIAAAASPAAFNALIPQAKNKAQKKALNDAATAMGFTFDKGIKAFVGPEPEAPQDTQESPEGATDGEQVVWPFEAEDGEQRLSA
jgi:hypothetical protein